ncbi:MAG: quercetin 2,3-dioxygenase [Solirubrobacteraceae bacterium]
MTNLIHTHTPRSEQIPSTGATNATATEEPYFTDRGEARWYGNSLWEFLVPNEVTGGKLSVFQATMPEGFGPPRHIHTREDEVFLVVDGEVCFDIDGQMRIAGPGAAMYMPRGVPHTFRIQSPRARLLGVMAPGAFEELFRNLSVPAGERTLPMPGSVPFDVPAVMAEQERLGTLVVGPPMSAVDASRAESADC